MKIIYAGALIAAVAFTGCASDGGVSPIGPHGKESMLSENN